MNVEEVLRKAGLDHLVEGLQGLRLDEFSELLIQVRCVYAQVNVEACLDGALLMERYALCVNLCAGL